MEELAGGATVAAKPSGGFHKQHMVGGWVTWMGMKRWRECALGRPERERALSVAGWGFLKRRNACQPRPHHFNRLPPHQVGTLEYMAPEVLLGGRHSCASDVYALGVTLAELASGIPPFSDCTRDNPLAHTVLEMGYGRCAATWLEWGLGRLWGARLWED